MAIEAKKLAAFAAAKGKGGKMGYGMKHAHGKVEMSAEHGKAGHPEAHLEKGEHGKMGYGMPHGKAMPSLDNIAAMIDAGKGDPKLTELGRELGEGVPHWAKSHELFEMALEQVEERWDEFEDPYVVVVHLYVAMGGEIDPSAAADDVEYSEEEEDEE